MKKSNAFLLQDIVCTNKILDLLFHSNFRFTDSDLLFYAYFKFTFLRFFLLNFIESLNLDNMFLLTGQPPLLPEPKDKTSLLAHAEKDEPKGYQNDEDWPFGGGEIVAKNYLCGKNVAT